MSRVAKSPIHLPTNVMVKFEQGVLSIKGPKGELEQKCSPLVCITEIKEPKSLVFKPASNDPAGWAHAGTMRANINNMVKGVTVGFEMTLELVGVGYRAQMKEKSLSLSLGYSHNIDYELPNEITCETPNNTTIVLKGLDKQLLGQVASEIRRYRPPEPYKGKGIKKSGEVIARKEAKKK